jgi:hypothetical protein
MLQDEVELSRWNQMLDQDVEILKANENTSKIRSVSCHFKSIFYLSM